MKKQASDRRRFLKNTAAMGTLYPFAKLAGNLEKDKQVQNPLHVVCVGGHPDDPESGCGGTLIKYAQSGHKVSIVYLTRGEAGIEGRSKEDAAKIRTAEAEKACSIIGATPYFLGQIDGSSFFNKEAIMQTQNLLQKLQPDVVFTHWPLDTHPDHQVASLLSFQSWLRLKKTFALYYFEVNSGDQTLHFNATDYVDISTVAEQKKKALYAHASQNPDDIYFNHHAVMQKFRGREIGVREAEAFIRVDAQTTSLNI